MKYADLFEQEAGGHVAAIRSILVAFDASDPGTEPGELLRQLRNESHGLVGVASAVGLETVRRLMEAVEHAAVTLGRGGTEPSGALLRAVREAVDVAEALGRAAVGAQDPPGPVNVEDLIAAVRTGAQPS